MLMTKATDPDFANDEPLLPTIVIFIASWMIASLFMQVMTPSARSGAGYMRVI
jgi:hypothetical protein